MLPRVIALSFRGRSDATSWACPRVSLAFLLIIWTKFPREEGRSAVAQAVFIYLDLCAAASALLQERASDLPLASRAHGITDQPNGELKALRPASDMTAECHLIKELVLYRSPKPHLQISPPFPTWTLIPHHPVPPPSNLRSHPPRPRDSC